MRGAVATGNRQTTDAAVAVLRAGGNAVDAAIAGCLASFVAEPLLSSVGGAGMMTVALVGQPTQVVDFFPPMAGLGRSAAPRDFVAVDVDFGSATQVFHVGRGSAAAPMTLAGLAEASRRFGRLPLHRVVEPAVELAREGAIVTDETAQVFRLLWAINTLAPETARTYSPTGATPEPGARLRMPGVAKLLEAFGRELRSPRHFDDAVLEAFGERHGGSLTPADLEAAQPLVGPPRRSSLAGAELQVSPRLGGQLVALIARRLADEPPTVGPDEWARLARTSREGSLAKGSERALGSTTHISVVDGRGSAAAVTLTNGEGCGHVIAGSDVQLNNFLGEEDLHPNGFFAHAPGTPLPSMIAPTIVRSRDGVLALGSGGANRIRSVVAQVLYRVIVTDAPLENAVLCPRVHAEADAVWYEATHRDAPPSLSMHTAAEQRATKGRLERDFPRVFDFPHRDFFFGGVHAVRQGPQRTEAFADPRRGGRAVVVDVG